MTTGNTTGSILWRSSILAAAILFLACIPNAPAQVAPLAPRWLAGTPPPPVETFSAGLQRHEIGLSEPELIAALRNPDGEVRSLAAAQLAAMDDHPALKYIVRAFQDEREPQVQVNIAGAATWLGSRQGLQQLETMCQDVNVPSMARLDAARYVSNKNLPVSFSAIQQIFRTDQDADVRLQAILSAANYRGQTEGAQAIAARALTDVAPGVRIVAADTLRRLRATNEVRALNRALESEGNGTVREHLREALRVLSDRGPSK